MNTSNLPGPVLILIGVLFLISAYLSWDDVVPEIGIEVYNLPSAWQFWIPHHYSAVTIPDYAITYLVIGTATLTAGTVLSIQEIRKRNKYAAAGQTLKEI